MLKTRGTELQQAVTEVATQVAEYFAVPLDQSSSREGDNFSEFPAHNGVAQDYFNTRKVSIYAESNRNGEYHGKISPAGL